MTRHQEVIEILEDAEKQFRAYGSKYDLIAANCIEYMRYRLEDNQVEFESFARKAGVRPTDSR